ncbi:MAG: methyl-accepting chemotaxis protein [Methylophilaceae bacterium]
MAFNKVAIKSLPQKMLGNSKVTGSNNNASIKRAGLKQVYLQAAAFIIFAGLAFWVINEVRVNEQAYNAINEYQDLIADTLPASLYPVDAFAAYNQAYIASANLNNDKRDQALTKAAKYETLFKTRSAFWLDKLKGTSLENNLNVVVKSGNNFFVVAKESLTPALPLGAAVAASPLSELTSAFEDTQLADEALTKSVSEEKAKLLNSQQSYVRNVLFGLALGLALLVLMFVYGRKQAKQAAELTEQLAQEGRNNQAAVSQLLDEMGDLSDGDLSVKAQVKDNIARAIADSINYTIDNLRDLVIGINRATEQVTNATAVAQTTSAQLLAAAETQSDQIMQTTDAVTDMTRSILQVSQNATQASEVALRSLEAANLGTQAVQNTISGMNDIRSQIQETSKRIKRLGESSQEISEIVELISDITEQTNILALNAAIQAASAGEAGRGFTVVAEEVQRLAERSSEATKQISIIVKTIQTDTHGAVAAMEKSTEGVVEGARVADAAGQALNEIESVTVNLARLIESISTATKAQTKSATMVSNNMQIIQEITTQTTDGTKLTANSVGQLTSLAEDLRTSVAGFKL